MGDCKKVGKEEMQITFKDNRFSAILPLPPISNNRLIPVRGRLILAKPNRNYHKDIQKLGMGKKPFQKPVCMEIVFYRKMARGDIDGRLKSLFDSLKGIMYLDDGQIDEMHVFNKKDAANPRVEIICYEL